MLLLRKAWYSLPKRIKGMIPERMIEASAVFWIRGTRLFRSSDVGFSLKEAIAKAKTASKEKNWPEAVRRWQAVLDATDEPATIHNYRTAKLRDRSNLNDWLGFHWLDLATDLESVKDNAPTSPSPELSLWIANILVENGYIESADRLLDRARRMFPKHLWLTMRYADVAMIQKDWPLAAKRWQHVLDVFISDSPFSAYAHLARAYRKVGTYDADRGLEETMRLFYSKMDGIQKSWSDNERTLSSFRTAPSPKDTLPLHLIVLSPGSILFDDIGSGIYLTNQEISSRLLEMGHKMGALDTGSSSRYLRRITKRMANRFGTDYAPSLALPPKMLSNAVFQAIYQELATLLPLRHLARHIASEAGNQPVYIELPSATITYLNGWSPNQLAPFYLYVELRRRGGNAFLCLQQDSPCTGGGQHFPLALRFLPHQSWTRLQALSSSDHAAPNEIGKAIVPAGIRNVDHVLGELGDVHIFASGYVVQPSPHAAPHPFRTQGFSSTIYPSERPPKEIVLPFEPSATLTTHTVDGRPDTGIIATANQINSHLLHRLSIAFGDFLLETARNAAEEVNKRQIQELHICDGYFLESSILSYAVKAIGGSVVLWPHSSKPVCYDMRCSEEFDRVYAATKSGEEIWRQYFPGKQYEIRPHLMFPKDATFLNREEGKPLTIVVVGGASILGRLPLCDLKVHFKSYQRFFSALADLQDHVDVVFKPKGSWNESAAWLSRLVGRQVDWHVSNRHPLEMHYPNMVFVSITHGSTALIEGICRGIPAIIVRDCKVEDFALSSNMSIPILKSDESKDFVLRCIDREFRQDLINQQANWFRSELGV